MLFRDSRRGPMLDIRLSPSANENKIIGPITDAAGATRLKVSVTAAPDKGKANAALIKLLAAQWHTAKSNFTLVSGETSRFKTVLLDVSLEKLKEIQTNILGGSEHK